MTDIDLCALKEAIEDRLRLREKETARICWEAIVNIANEYSPSLAKQDTAHTSDRAKHFRHIQKSIYRLLLDIKHTSEDCMSDIHEGMLPKAAWTRQSWDPKTTTTLVAWYGDGSTLFNILSDLGDANGAIALGLEAQTLPPNGRRPGCGPQRGPEDVLIYELMEVAQQNARPKAHVKPIADAVHRWATDNPDSPGVSQRAWARVQKLFPRAKKVEGPPLT
jgi:hypothetical protein